MEHLVANCDNNRFDLEIALEQQLGIQNLPFSGMDKSGSAICVFYLKGMCQRGSTCPLRHTTGNQNTVCKHWLRGLCKKGDTCEFLHEYDMTKMPECYFFQRLGQCCNKECPFLHIDPETKIKDCAWYDRGFCRHGTICKNRHVRRVICPNYLFGFCPEGKLCKFMHPRFELPTIMQDPTKEKKAFTCHTCGEAGHKAAWCLKKHLFRTSVAAPVNTIPYQPMTQPNGVHVTIVTSTTTNTVKTSDPSNRHAQVPESYVPGQRRPLDQVTCFKCGDQGHYANRCPKGHLAFLHNAANLPVQDK